MKLIKSILLATPFLLISCASKPESISPEYISESKYQGWKCNALGAEYGRYSEALARASSQQRKARRKDAWGVALVGLPVSTLSGSNSAGEIGRLKGEIEAIARARGKAGCP